MTEDTTLGVATQPEDNAPESLAGDDVPPADDGVAAPDLPPGETVEDDVP